MIDLSSASDVPTEPVRSSEPVWTPKTFIAGAVLAGLVVAADILFYRQLPGINLAIFAFALSLGILAIYPEKLGQARTMLLFVVAVVSALPLVEEASVTGFLTAQSGIALLALGMADKLPKFEDWAGTLTRFGLLAPFRLAGDGLRLLGEAANQKLGGRLLRGAVVWIVPLVFAVVFVFLFTAANPLVEAGLRAIRLDKLLELLEPVRVILWGIVAVTCWPVLRPKLLTLLPIPETQGPVLPRAESLLFGTAAIRNSLIVFNALFAVQTVMDLLYLWGGLRLPDGMTHAEYAHRGAYPLVATAILAGLFVLAAMRQGGAGEKSSLIRNLVFLWIGQNVWLVISSLLRLKLYVEAYMLSELRVYSAIWMGLVAVGLLLIIAKIVLGRTNRWLVMSNMVALGVTLWGVSLADVRWAVAEYNVDHSREVTGEGQSFDLYYIDDLGPAAIPAIDRFLSIAKYASDDTINTFEIERGHLVDRMATDHAWQSWTWRSDRLDRYLVDHPYASPRRPAIN